MFQSWMRGGVFMFCVLLLNIFSCIELKAVRVYLFFCRSCSESVLPVCIQYHPFVLCTQHGTDSVSEPSSAAAFRFRRTSEKFQTLFLLCSSSAALQRRAMPSSVWERQTSPVPKLWSASIVITRTRLSHILALGCAPTSRINLGGAQSQC